MSNTCNSIGVNFPVFAPFFGPFFAGRASSSSSSSSSPSSAGVTSLSHRRPIVAPPIRFTHFLCSSAFLAFSASSSSSSSGIGALDCRCADELYRYFSVRGEIFDFGGVGFGIGGSAKKELAAVSSSAFALFTGLSTRVLFPPFKSSVNALFVTFVAGRTGSSSLSAL
jgi:hypothetical protein